MTEWNDDRLDELNERVKDGFIAVDKRFEQVDERFVRLEGEMKDRFAEVDKRFIRIEGEMKAGFAQIDKRFEKADERFATREEMGEVKVQLNRLNDRFDRLIFVLIAACVGLIGTFLVAAVGLILQG